MPRTRPGVLILRAPEGDQTHPLAQSVTTIGRSATCDVVIPLPTVSRIHALVEVRQDRYVLLDSDSANGTFVNGARVEGQRQLATGDTIWLGTPAATLGFSDPEETLLVEGVAPAPLLIDDGARAVYVFGVPVQLSPIEYRLLRHLAASPGGVVTREDLFREVWGQPYDHATCEDALNAAVAKLRRNLRASAGEAGVEPPAVTTIPRVGFRLDAESSFAQRAGRERMVGDA